MSLLDFDGPTLILGGRDASITSTTGLHDQRSTAKRANELGAHEA